MSGLSDYESFFDFFQSDVVPVADPFPPTLDDLNETFEYLEEWDERYAYLIEIGKQVPPLGDEAMTEENRVHGCMSSVWLVTEHDKASDRMKITAFSDSLIVNGLIVILMAAFSEKTPSDVVQFEIDTVFAELGLNQHLSSNRRNGLFSMVKRVKELATGYLSA